MAIPTSVRGYVDDTLFGTILHDALEYVPDLAFPTSVRTYTQMRRDAQLAAVLAGYTLQLRRAQWQIDGHGCRPQVVKLVADDLGLAVAGSDEPSAARLRGVSWGEHLRAALLELVYGFSGFELQADVASGQARLAGLWERPAHTIGDIHIDPKTGAFLGITQDLGRGGEVDKPQIRADRMVWYCHDREGAGWQGSSLLRPAYGPWLIKREMQRVLATSNRRFGMGVPTVEWAAGVTPSPQQQREAMRAASAARVGDQSGLALPPGAHLVLAGLSGSTPDTLAFIRWLDQQMSRMALMGFIDLGETPNGSRALGETFVDAFLLALETLAEQIADTATRQIAARLVEWNWGPDEPVPRVVASGVGSRREVTAESLQLLLSSGALSADPGLEEWVRREYRLPERTEPPPSQRPPRPRPRPAGPSPQPDDGQDGEAGGEPEEGEQQPDQADEPDRRVAAAQRRGRRPFVDGQLELPVFAAGRELTAVEQQSGIDPDQLDEDVQQALEDLTDQWPDLTTELVAAISGAAVAAAAAGTLAQLASYTPPAVALSGITAAVTTSLTGLATVSAGRAAAELATQGMTVPAGDVDTARLADVAEATVGLLASGYVNSAARAALRTVGADPDVVETAVRGVLGDLSQAAQRGWVVQTLSSALVTAQAEGRLATFDAAPDGVVFYASEISDPNRCEPCRRVDGRRFTSLADAVAAYPAGKYRHCLGGDRCRGRLIAVVPDTIRVTAAADEEAADLLTAALAHVAGDRVQAAQWREEDHPRNPKGTAGAGRFRSLTDRIADAVKDHSGSGDPFEGFSREQLRRAAKARGLTLQRGESRESIARRLLDDVRGAGGGSKPAKKTTSPASGEDAMGAVPAGLNRRRRPGEPALTRPQRAALRDYESSFYVAINGQLRRDEVEPLVARRVARIDEAMGASRLATDVHVWRGITNADRLFGNRLDGDMTGLTWRELAYTSTTADRDVAASFTYPGAGERPVLMRIRVPEGTGAVRISELGDQAEILLSRGLTMRVVADRGESPQGHRLLEVEVVADDAA